jgi:hypothetical protein
MIITLCFELSAHNNINHALLQLKTIHAYIDCSLCSCIRRSKTMKAALINQENDAILSAPKKPGRHSFSSINRIVSVKRGSSRQSVRLEIPTFSLKHSLPGHVNSDAHKMLALISVQDDLQMKIEEAESSLESMTKNMLRTGEMVMARSDSDNDRGSLLFMRKFHRFRVEHEGRTTLIRTLRRLDEDIESGKIPVEFYEGHLQSILQCHSKLVPSDTSEPSDVALLEEMRKGDFLAPYL